MCPTRRDKANTMRGPYPESQNEWLGVRIESAESGADGAPGGGDRDRPSWDRGSALQLRPTMAGHLGPIMELTKGARALT